MRSTQQLLGVGFLHEVGAFYEDRRSVPEPTASLRALDPLAGRELSVRLYAKARSKLLGEMLIKLDYSLIELAPALPPHWQVRRSTVAHDLPWLPRMASR